MANGGFPVGSANIDIGVNLAPMNAELQRAEQLTNSIAKNIQSSVDRGATGAATSLTHLGTAAVTTQNQINRLDATIQNQAQALKIAEQRLDSLATTHNSASQAVMKQQLVVDKLNRSLLVNGEMVVQLEDKLRGYEAATASATQQTNKFAGVFSGVGAQIAGGLGIAGGISQITSSVVQLGKESIALAQRAETIGTAYTSATKRASVSADELLHKLQETSRGTVSDVDLMASANKALALGVGENTEQIGNLLAIARQKGKDFGLSTAQAFEDITTGLGRLSPRILDNLGIILDENKIYQEYARSIGVAEGKLSDQEKRQALVNALLRDNSDLVAKNATANLDALDKVAIAQAELQRVQVQFGKDILPAEIALLKDLSAVFKSLPGAISSDVDAINSDIERQATSYEDYVRRINAARNKLNPTGKVGHETTADERTGNLLLSGVDNRDEFALAKQADAHQRNAAAAEANATALRKANAAGQDHIITIDEQITSLDHLSAALQAATNQGLRPYQAAVDAAKTSLDRHQKSTAAAKDTVDSISGALTKAKATYQEFATARLAEDEKYRKGLADLDLQHAIAEQRLADFKAPGAGLDQLLAPIQSQIDAAAASTDDWKQKLDAANQAVSDQEQVLAGATAEQKNYDNAVGDAKDNLDAQQSRLEALQGVYDNLGEAIQSAKRDMDDLRHTALVGEGALDDKLFAMEQNIKRQQLVIDQARLSGAGKDEIKKLTEQLDKLRTAEDAARLAGELRYDKQHRALEQQGVPRDEQTFDKASHDIGQYQQGIEQLTKAQEAAGQAVDDQKTKVRDAQFDLMDATAVQRDHTAAVDAEKAALDKLKDAQKVTNDQYTDAKTRLADLKTQLNDTKDNALKPYQDKIDEIGRQASALKLAEKMEIDPLRAKIEALTTKTKLLTFQEIIDGLNNTNAVIQMLNPQLDHANVILKAEQDATKAAQITYDQATAALTAEQKYFDALATGLSDMKEKLQAIKDLYPDLATLTQLINAANGGTAIPGQRAPFTGQTGATGAGPDAKEIDAILAGSGLAGEGAAIARYAAQYHVPASLALAMFRKEASFAKPGSLAAQNNNPGNIVDTGGAYGEDRPSGNRFGHYATLDAGVEAYFKLLDREYRRYLDSGNIAGLIAKYAPAFENNTAEYIREINEWMADYAKAIQGAATAAKTHARGSVSEATAAGVADPILSDQAIDTVLPGGHQTGSYHGDRVEMGTASNPQGIDLHQGVDLAGTAGMDVRAPRSGHVVFAGPNKYGGTAVIIENDAGEQWYFGHLRGDINVGVGSRVNAGDVIGHINPDFNHVHVQEVKNGQITDPTTTLEELAAATGAGPSAADLQTLLAYVQAMQKAGATYDDLYPKLPKLTDGVANLLPNLDDLIRAVEGVGTAAADTAAGMVNATDDILNHATYKNRDGSGQLAYINQNGGLSGAGNWTRTGPNMGIGGPHFGAPIVTPPNSMQGNDPTQDAIASVGAAVMGLQDTTASTFDGIAKLTPGWKETWQTLGDASVAEIDRAQQFMFGAEQNILQYVTSAEQRIDDLIGKILSIPGIHVSTGPSKSDPGGVNDPGQPGGPPAPPTPPGPTSYSTVNYYTRDSDRAIRAARSRGYSF